MSQMGAYPYLDLARILVGISILTYAALSDVRVRKVENGAWYLALAGGLVLLFANMALDGAGVTAHIIWIALLACYLPLLFDSGERISFKEKTLTRPVWWASAVAGAIAVLYLLYSSGGNAYELQLATIPILAGFFFLLYQTGALHGGADAKALMVYAVLVPIYPVLHSSIPLLVMGGRAGELMQLFFPFALVVLMNSVLFLVFLPLFLFIYNMAGKNRGGMEMFLGYRTPLEGVGKKHVWLMERVEDGARIKILFPKRNRTRDIPALKEEGVERVWVSPQIPFMVPLLSGFLAAVLFGNIIFGIMELLF